MLKMSKIENRFTAKTTSAIRMVVETGKNSKETSEIVDDVLKLKDRSRGPKKSMISYPHRGFFGDNKFSGNASGWLLVDLINGTMSCASSTLPGVTIHPSVRLVLAHISLCVR